MSETVPSTAMPVSRLIEEFSKLPGVGPKSAQRLTYYLLRASPEDAQALAQAILEVKEKIILCSLCQHHRLRPLRHLPQRPARPKLDLHRGGAPRHTGPGADG